MLTQTPAYYSLQLEQAESLNQALLRGFGLSSADGSARRSHFYQGRYENVYIGSDKIPQIEQVLLQARVAAASILQMDVDMLKAGLWFNAMPPGSKTLKHAHDDDDELLSAVYYVTVPENSGHLVLYAGVFSTHVMPQPGMFVFFPPSVQHEVTENCSAELRLSLGINIGPVNCPD
jgi:uncharacterized RmlC-like cupin family protein